MKTTEKNLLAAAAVMGSAALLSGKKTVSGVGGGADKQRVIITATDNIGREESITLVLDQKPAEELLRDPYYLEDLCYRYEQSRFYSFVESYLSPAQYRKVRDFQNLIHHKFYIYSLETSKK